MKSWTSVLGDSLPVTQEPNAFSPQYTSQIVAFKPDHYKRPVIVQPTFPIHDTIAASEDGKRARLLKASI